MKLKLILIPALVLIVSCLALGCYSVGKAEGTAFGYAQGLRVADAWERRAKACEETK